MSELSRNNHYVPEWYQKGFIQGSRGTFHRLDLNPPSKELADGRMIAGRTVELRSPKGCFAQEDLYTTRFGETLNDEVERLFFGPIDGSGALAVRAFADNDPQAIHNHFKSFFEYLDAQKLRTPKGLDWIFIRYPNLTQVELMVEMQRLRNMHCTMWVECVREIVSAEQSDVKFIVSDHPVTAYNAACAPASLMCQYPDDPPISLNGTQTIFALDADHCLILTNLEYAKDPGGVDPLAPRQNARYTGSTLVRTNALIRSRSLTRHEVVAINSVLKARSSRFLAAYEREWLFPESDCNIAWEDIGKVLLPPKAGLWDFGGEMFVGYKDGSKSYRDPFGRVEPGYEALKKKAPAAPGPNDPCGCGSGRLYGKCCDGVAKGDRPPWDIYGIRERNRIFCNAVDDILGLNRGKSWEAVRRDLSDEQVKRIHEVVATLWPTDTNLADLLPRPDNRYFRAVYMGIIDPRTIAQAVIGPLAYFDEIYVLNPFPNPRYMSCDMSPTQSPSMHKPQLLKNLTVLFGLQPLIDAGIVHLVPDPMEFNSAYRRELLAMAKERSVNWSPTDDEMQFGIDLGSDDFRRTILRLSEDQLRRLIRESDPTIDSEMVDDVVKYMKSSLLSDPLALLQPLPKGSDEAEMHRSRVMTTELALYVAHLTGATVYTDQQLFWRQLHEQTSARDGRPSRWAPLVRRIGSHLFPIELNPLINLEIREARKLCRMRRIFHEMWCAAQAGRRSADDDQIAQELAGRLRNEALRSTRDWDECTTTNGSSIRSRKRIQFSVPPAGFDLNSVHRLLVTSGRDSYLASIPAAFLFSSVDA